MAPAPPPAQCDLSSGRSRTYLKPTLALALSAPSRGPKPAGPQRLRSSRPSAVVWFSAGRLWVHLPAQCWVIEVMRLLTLSGKDGPRVGSLSSDLLGALKTMEGTRPTS